jgi:hypothetical protein
MCEAVKQVKRDQKSGIRYQRRLVQDHQTRGKASGAGCTRDGQSYAYHTAEDAAVQQEQQLRGGYEPSAISAKPF